MLRINKPGKAGLRAAQGTCLGFRAGKPLKLQTTNKNAAGMQGSHISSVGFISVMFKLQLTNLRILSQFLHIYNKRAWLEAPLMPPSLGRKVLVQVMLSR